MALYRDEYHSGGSSGNGWPGQGPGEGGCNWHSCHQLAALAVRQHPSECRHGIVATTVAVTVTVAITVVVVAIVIVIIIMIIFVAVAVVLVLLMKQQQRQQQAEQQKRVNHKSKS